jgi:hypothetical protein
MSHIKGLRVLLVIRWSESDAGYFPILSGRKVLGYFPIFGGKKVAQDIFPY